MKQVLKHETPKLEGAQLLWESKGEIEIVLSLIKPLD